MRDEAQFPVIHCKMTETVMQADCGTRGELGPWRMIAMEKLVPISPRDCLNISDSGKTTLFNRAVALTRNGMAIETLEERVNCDSRSRNSIRRSSGGPGKAYVQLTMRRIAVWRSVANESITKKVIVKGVHDSIQIMWQAEWTPQRALTSGTTPRETALKKNGRSCTIRCSDFEM
jgi:hypothetical protein